MKNEFIFNLKELSIEIIILSLIVFGLTMLVKWPIKKITSKFDENKRKAINTVIVFIPIILSFLLNILYFGIFKKTWCTQNVFESAGSTYILAISVYAIFSRIAIIIKGSKRQTSTDKEDMSKETVNFIKKNIKTISKSLKIDEQKLEDVVVKINNLLTIRNQIYSNENLQDISSIEDLDIQLSDLHSKEETLKKSITDATMQVNAYQKSLK